VLSINHSNGFSSSSIYHTTASLAHSNDQEGRRTMRPIRKLKAKVYDMPGAQILPALSPSMIRSPQILHRPRAAMIVTSVAPNGTMKSMEMATSVAAGTGTSVVAKGKTIVATTTPSHLPQLRWPQSLHRQAL
jgi:hypothetical protein